MKQITYLATAALALVLFVFAAPGQATAQGADDPAQIDAGKAVYETSCAGCHGDDGGGVAGLGRPLTDIASQGDRATHIGSITEGKGSMPAFGPNLSDEEIDQVASYVRLAFAPEVTASTEPELARTGVDTGGLAIIGVAMVAGGAQLVRWSRRQD